MLDEVRNVTAKVSPVSVDATGRRRRSDSDRDASSRRMPSPRRAWITYGPRRAHRRRQVRGDDAKCGERDAPIEVVRMTCSLGAYTQRDRRSTNCRLDLVRAMHHRDQTPRRPTPILGDGCDTDRAASRNRQPRCGTDRCPTNLPSRTVGTRRRRESFRDSRRRPLPILRPDRAPVSVRQPARARRRSSALPRFGSAARRWIIWCWSCSTIHRSVVVDEHRRSMTRTVTDGQISAVRQLSRYGADCGWKGRLGPHRVGEVVRIAV